MILWKAKWIKLLVAGFIAERAVNILKDFVRAVSKIMQLTGVMSESVVSRISIAVVLHVKVTRILLRVPS